MEPQIDILSEEDLQLKLSRRRALLPWWVKTFLWIFMVCGAVVPLTAIAAVFGISPQLSLYGLDANGLFSFAGILLVLVFALKGVTAFGLWTEKNWAIQLGLVDAILGIAICAYVMFVAPLLYPGFKMSLRLELVALIPYLLWLRKTKSAWDERAIMKL